MSEENETTTAATPSGLMRAKGSGMCVSHTGAPRRWKGGDVWGADDPDIEGRENLFEPFDPEVSVAPIASADPDAIAAATAAAISPDENPDGDDSAAGDGDAGGQVEESPAVDRPGNRAAVKTWVTYVQSIGADGSEEDLLALDRADLVALADMLEAKKADEAAQADDSDAADTGQGGS